MELLFPVATISAIRQVKSEVQTMEQSQELHMPEDYPDIGKILSSWGQVLLRGKEWRGESMVINCGVMVWILYQPEDENLSPRTVEAWIPIQMKWDLPHLDVDGEIRAVPLLRSVDSRLVSARKLMARAAVSMLAEAYVREDVQTYTIPEHPKDIHILACQYPMLLRREAGEKTFDIDEELQLPGSCPKAKQILRFSAQPELIDQKVMSGKIVFRGILIVHMLYSSAQEELCTWDFEVPFSRYADLSDVYEQEARSTVMFAVTSLELQETTEGCFSLKAGVTGQYMIYDRSVIEMAQDAYSPGRELEVISETAELPTVLEIKNATIATEQTAPMEGRKIVDMAFYPAQPQLQKTGQGVKVLLSGQYHILSTDGGKYYGNVYKWSGEQDLPADETVRTEITMQPSGSAQNTGSAGQVVLRSDLMLETVVSASEELSMITKLIVGEYRPADPERSCVILRRAGKDSLWQIAKNCGSSVVAIKEANGLKEEPEPDQMLLVPMV